jgi:hypothetical protein
MKNITINTNNPENFYTMIIPEDYQKIPLPYFKEWTEALDSGSYLQAKSRLYETIVSNEGEVCSYCCLGILSKIQGRLTEDGRDIHSEHYLSSNNPNVNIFGTTGRFPAEITVKLGDFNTKILSLSHLNDLGVPFSEISKVIKEIWKEESLDNEQ